LKQTKLSEIDKLKREAAKTYVARKKFNEKFYENKFREEEEHFCRTLK
jgi:hypothetical protein